MEIKTHRLRIQYQIGNKNIYSNHIEIEHVEGITVQELYFQMVSFLSEVESHIKDKKIYQQACKVIIDKLLQHAKICNMFYIPAKYTESILETKRGFSSKKFKGERIDLEIRFAVVPFIDDGSIISQVIKIFRDTKK